MKAIYTFPQFEVELPYEPFECTIIQTNIMGTEHIIQEWSIWSLN